MNNTLSLRAVLALLAAGLLALAGQQWRTQQRMDDLQAQLRLRPPIVVLDDPPAEAGAIRQDKVRRLAAAGYLVLKRSQVMAVPDDRVLFQPPATDAL